MRHWLSMFDYEPQELAELVRFARELKAGSTVADAIRNRILTMVFFNPSLRTRTSFEAAMMRYGGYAICLNVGGDTWNLEYKDGVIMNGSEAEHIREAAPVLSRYGHALAVRTFAAMRDGAEDAQDMVIRAFGRFATVPVINMESAAEHPCQGLADWMTIDEKLNGTRGKRFVLSWAPHVRGLPMAVSQSAVLSAAAAGMDVTIAHPAGYDLAPGIVERAKAWCAASGTQLRVTDDQHAACDGADVVYVKSWGSSAFYGDAESQRKSFEEHADWMVTPEHLAKNSLLMHCLPVRRNVVISDAAMDDARSVVVDQAENRMWAQAAILQKLFRQSNTKEDRE